MRARTFVLAGLRSLCMLPPALPAFLLLFAASGCASLMGTRLPPPADGWTRETVDLVGTRCSPAQGCRTILETAAGRHEVRTEVRRYAPHEIPGWDARSRADRGVAGAVGWLFAVGIAPPRDSLALVYHTLEAEQSPLVSRRPPIALDHFAPAETADGSYTVVRKEGGFRLRLHVSDTNGAPLAILHVGAPATRLDLAPHASPAEREILRLVAALHLVSELPGP
jgi:hypothetical protein